MTAELTFESLEFNQENDKVVVTLLKHFFFELDIEDIRKIGEFNIKSDSIEFPSLNEKQANKFYFLISKGMKNLKNKLNKKPAVYIHKNSRIPLIGNLAFGIVDRGSTIIEVKPLTSCNINCIFCSVDEGITSNKANDFIVEEEYLVEELASLIEYKEKNADKKIGSNKYDIFINPHGEPLLYGDIIKLVEDIKALDDIDKVSIATNGNLLNEKIIDDLSKAGLDRFNFSINSLDEKKARMIAGTKKYDILHVKKMIDHIIKNTKIGIVLAPVWMPGMNDKDVEDIIQFCNEKGCDIGIQKYISHKKGRNPDIKEKDWKEFFNDLEKLEQQYDAELIFSCAPKKTEELPKPFKTGDIVKGSIMCRGRYKNETIAVAEGRNITVYDCHKNAGDDIRIKITKSKNNIFLGKAMN